ncbi:C-factor [Glycine max]|nr:C-factor [Glycine max]
MLLPPTHMALHSPRLLSLTRRAFSSSPSSFQGGVSMVQGASRGIGLEFVKQILEYDDKEHVIATCRNPSASTGLIHLKDKFADRLKILSLDLTVETSIEHMWPLLKVGGGHGTGRSAAVVASLSARVASIGDNRLGVSKTASLEFARRKDPVVCILLHPGTVDTDLSKPFQRNVPPDKLFTKEFSVQKLLSIINNVKIHDNGKFFAWDGQEIPW